MNEDLINELIEAKAENRFAEVIQEKIAALDITTEEEFGLLCDVVEDKAASMDKEASALNLRNAVAASALAVIPGILIGGYLLGRLQKTQTLDQVLKDKPDLKANLKRTKDHFDMLFHIAPNLMSNHIIAGSILDQLSQYDMIDHQMIGKLIEAERNMAQARKENSVNSTIKAIGDTAGAANNVISMLDPSKRK